MGKRELIRLGSIGSARLALRSLAAGALLCASLLAVGAGGLQNASAQGGIGASGSCGSVSVSGNTGHPNSSVHVAVSGVGSANGTADSSGSFNISVSGGPLDPGTSTLAAASDNQGFSAVTGYKAPDPCTAAGSITGDNRVEGRAGDRLAIWCNTTQNPPNIDVWGITNDSQGHALYRFTYAELVQAGAKGSFKNVEPLGAVFASVDVNNNFYVAWFGGPAGATGSGDFTKSFTCVFPKVAATAVP